MLNFKLRYLKLWTGCLALFLLVILLARCQQTRATAVTGPVQFDPTQAPYPTLSEYAFFRGETKALRPNEGVIPYELITPLFTDYAHKARFVWMPDSLHATVDEAGVIRFPDNAVLIKNFYYPADFRRPEADWDMVETRLLMKKAGQWEAYTYLWNEEQTEARLSLIGDLRPVSWIDKSGRRHEIEYVAPNKNQCKSCHNNQNKLEPIGPKVRNLNRPLTYPDTGPANQIERWRAEGLLVDGPWSGDHPPVADWDDPQSGTLEERAIAYLDINCGHCHRPEGPAHTSGLYLTVDYQDQPDKLGVYKTPVAAGKGSGNRKYGIQPGQPDSSILVYRMESEDPGIMMPELGRVVKHREGIELVRTWIEGL